MRAAALCGGLELGIGARDSGMVIVVCGRVGFEAVWMGGAKARRRGKCRGSDGMNT